MTISANKIKSNGVDCYEMTLTVKAGAIRNVTQANPISSEVVQDLISLLDGVAVNARAYSSTNMCFDVDAETLEDAISASDIPDFRIEKVREKFIKKHLACTLPLIHVIESREEIEEAIKNAQ